MSYTAKEFANVDLSLFTLTDKPTCGACSLPITDTPSNEIPTLDGKPAHQACYDAALSELVEAHPVRRIPRG